MNQDDLWHTNTLLAFNQLNFDQVLNRSNLTGSEQAIKISRDSDDFVMGFEASKHHAGKTVSKTYFIPTTYAERLPIKILETRRCIFQNKVYNIVTKAITLRIEPENVIGFRKLVESSGIMMHTVPKHYTLFKIIVLWLRLGKGCARVVTDSAFGKDKYIEMVKLLLNSTSVLTDPTIAKLNNRIQHDKLVCLSEMPGKQTGEDFQQLCNTLMVIGDDRQILENRARSSRGTMEEAVIGDKSVFFIHNPSSYYNKVGKKAFHQIFPYNVQNRYLQFQLKGYTQATFTRNLDNKKYALENQQVLRDWSKTALWYHEHWHELTNPYGVPERYMFAKKEERYRTNFVRLALAISQWAENSDDYYDMLEVAYQAHDAQRREDAGDEIEVKEMWVDRT